MILLFWFLILALALAWGIAGFQEERIAASKPPPAIHAPVAAKPVAPVAPVTPVVPAAQGTADGTTEAGVDKDSPKADDAR